MAIAKQEISVVFGQGMDLYTSDTSDSIGSFELIQNMESVALGEIRERQGYFGDTLVPTLGYVTRRHRLVDVEGRPWAVGYDSRATTGSAERTTRRTMDSESDIVFRPTYALASGTTYDAVTLNDGTLVVVYYARVGLLAPQAAVEWIDPTGRVIASRLLGTALNNFAVNLGIRVFDFGAPSLGVLVIHVTDSGTPQLSMSNPSVATAGSTLPIANLSDADTWDACKRESNDVFVAAIGSGSSTTLRSWVVNGSLSIPYLSTNPCTASTGGIGVARTASNENYVFYNASGNLRAMAWNNNLSAVSIADTLVVSSATLSSHVSISAVKLNISSGEFLVAVAQSVFGTYVAQPIRRWTVNSTLTVATEQEGSYLARGVSVAGYAVLDGAVVSGSSVCAAAHVIGSDRSDLNQLYAVQYVADAAAIANSDRAASLLLAKARSFKTERIDPLYGIWRNLQRLHSVPGSQTRFRCIVLNRDGAFSRFDIYRDAQMQYDSDAGTVTVVTSGATLAMTQNELVPVGFDMPPSCEVALIDVGAGSLSAGTYQVRTGYEWTDSAGNLHRSPLSIPRSIVLGASRSIRVTEWPPPYDWRAGALQIVCYRTTANGTIFYREATTTFNPFGAFSAASVSFDLTTSDAALVSLAQAYTTGGVLDSFAPPSSRAITAHEGRLAVCDSDRANVVAFSKPLTPGIAPEFVQSTLFSVSCGNPSEPIAAISSLDGRLIAFKLNAPIFVIEGDGPDNVGNGSFGLPREVPTSYGLRDPQSVVKTQDGIYYNTEQGICVLTRGITSTLVGGPLVRDGGLPNLTIVAADHLPHNSQVRFLRSDGTIDVYNYREQQWYRWVSTVSDGGYSWIDTVSIGKVHYGLLQSGVSTFLLAQNPDVFWPADYVSGIPYPFVAMWRTNWIKLSQVLGFFRAQLFQLHGSRINDISDFTVRLFYDYEMSDVVSKSDSIFGASKSQFEMWFTRQKAQAIKIEFSDNASGSSLSVSNPEDVLKFDGITFAVRVKKGPYKQLPSGSRI